MAFTKTTNMFGKKEFMISVSEIKQEMFVREELDDDRIWYWAEKYANGEDVDAVEIAHDYSLTDGRHRVAGALLADKTEILCYVYPVKNKGEQLQRAFVANINTSGPKPPTKGDAIFAIKQMIGEGVKKSTIVELMEKQFPSRTVKEIYDEARHGIYRDKLRDAKRAVIDEGMTVANASTMYAIDEEKLKEELGGIRKKKSKANSAGEFNKLLSIQYRSNGQKVRVIFTKVEAAFKNGDMAKDEALKVFDYAAQSLRQRLRYVEDKRNRLVAR